MKFKSIVFGLTLPLACSVGLANAADPVEEAAATVPVSLSSNDLQMEVDRLVAGLHSQVQGAWFGSAIVTVGVSHTAPEWGQSRVLAFQRAQAEIENRYVQTVGQQIAVERFSDYFSDEAFEAEAFDWSGSGNDNTWRRLFNKAVALTEAKLNQLLNDMDVDTREFEQLPREQKQVQFRQSFQREVTRESFGELAGLLTFKNYEGFDEEGSYLVAVVAGVSDSMRQLAYQVEQSRGDVAPEPDARDTLSPIMEMSPEQLSSIYGIRRLHDQKGYPILASFGQWAVSYRGENSRRMNRARDHAYRQAEIQADASLAEFIRSSVTYADASKVGSVIEEAVVVNEDDQFRTDNTQSVIDVVRASSSRNADVKVTGITNLRRWSIRHPQNEDQMIVGVVRYWSPVNEAHIREVQSFQPDLNPGSSSEASANEGEAAPKGTIKGSDMMMDLDGF